MDKYDQLCYMKNRISLEIEQNEIKKTNCLLKLRHYRYMICKVSDLLIKLHLMKFTNRLSTVFNKDDLNVVKINDTITKLNQRNQILNEKEKKLVDNITFLDNELEELGKDYARINYYIDDYHSFDNINIGIINKIKQHKNEEIDNLIKKLS